MAKRHVAEEVLEEFALWLTNQGMSEAQVEQLLALEPGTVAQWRGMPAGHRHHALAPVVDTLLRQPWDDDRVRRGCLLRRPRENEKESPP